MKSLDKDMNPHQKAVENFEKVWSANLYQGFSKDTTGAASTPFLEKFIDFMASAKNRTARVAELGAGSGDHSIRLASEGFDVSCVESSTTAVKLINQRVMASKTKFTVLEKNLFEFVKMKEANSLDGVYANSVLHFLNKDERNNLYSELFRIQSENGILAVSFKAFGDALQKRGKKVEETSAGPVVEGEDRVRRLFVTDPTSLIDEIKKAGYMFIESISWSVHDYNIRGEDGVFVGLLAKKPTAHSNRNKS